VAGTDLTTQECLFTAAPIHPDETKHQWRVHIGFFEADWETGSSDEFWVQGYIPEIAFDEFLAAFKSGEANGLNLLCKANLSAASWVALRPHCRSNPQEAVSGRARRRHG
jgi:hypothetical protein